MEEGGAQQVTRYVSFPETHCWVGVPALPASSCVSFGMSPTSFVMPHFSHLRDRDDDGTHLTGLKWRLSECQ